MSPTERDPAFADNGIVTLQELGDEIVRLSRLRATFNVGASRVWSSIGDVFRNRGAEEERFLEDDTDAAAKLIEIDFTNVDAFNQNPPASWFWREPALAIKCPAGRNLTSLCGVVSLQQSRLEAV